MIPRSALVLAARRALAYQQNSPIMQDPLAHLFVDDEMMAFAKKTDAPIHYVLLRHRIMDDLLIKFKDSVEQLVILGAGFDTKFQRLDLPENLRFLEVDNDAVLQFKKEKLKQQHYKIPGYCPLIIKGTENWKEVLMSTDPNKPTMLIGEGFFMYQKDTLAMLKEAVTYYKKKLYIVFDMIDPALPDSQENQAMRQRLEKGGEKFSGLMPATEIETFFDDLGIKTNIFTPSLLASKYSNVSFDSSKDKYVYVVFANSTDY